MTDRTNIKHLVNRFREWCEFKPIDLKNSKAIIRAEEFFRRDSIQDFLNQLSSSPIKANETLDLFQAEGDKRWYKFASLISKKDLSSEVSDYDFSFFLERWGIFLSYLRAESSFYISIISGKEILYSYPLINSCMGGNRKIIKTINPTLLNLLLNQDRVKLILIFSKDSDKPLGRALLWRHDRKFYLDRVYPDNGGSHIFFLRSLSKSRGWINRTTNSYQGYWEEENSITLYKFKKMPLPYFDSFEIEDYRTQENNIFFLRNKLYKVGFQNAIHFFEDIILNSPIVDQRLDFKGLIDNHLIDRENHEMGEVYSKLNVYLPTLDLPKLNLSLDKRLGEFSSE